MIRLAIQSVVSEIKSLGVSGWKELLEVVWSSATCRQRWADFEVRLSYKVRSGWQGREVVMFGVSPRVEIL